MAIHGIRRRSAARASRASVWAFSFTSISCRAASQPSGDTIGGVLIGRCPLAASFSCPLSVSLLVAILLLLCLLKRSSELLFDIHFQLLQYFSEWPGERRAHRS